jgi:hypothetical protein
LVIAFGVRMFEELPDGVARRRFAKEDHPRQALGRHSDIVSDAAESSFATPQTAFDG